MIADLESMHHVARLAFFAMSARAVAIAEMENDPSIESMVFKVHGPLQADGASYPIEVEYLGAAGFPVGGMSL